MATDLYALLEVEPDATAAELKRAYRARALALHPDRNPGDAASEAQFKEVGRAWEILGDPAKRAEYDRSRGRPAAGPDADWLDTFDLVATTAWATLLEDVLPAWSARHGRGHALVAALREALDADAPLEGEGRASWLARWRARRLAGGLDLRISEDPWAMNLVAVRKSGGFLIVVYPFAFWRGGLRSDDDLRHALARVLVAAIATAVASSAGTRGRPDSRVAAALDREAAAHRLRWRAVWVGVFLLAAAMLSSAWWSTRGGRHLMREQKIEAARPE